MPGILPQIQHVVVVMLENRSFDNLCGWLYQDPPPPAQFLPGSSSATPFNGLNPGLFNPVQESYFTYQSGPTYPIFPQSNAPNMPNPDPEEDYPNVNYQLFASEAPNQNPRWANLGFVINYAKVTGTNTPVQIMEPFSPAQVPVLSSLARNFAISDAWYSSVPSNTWPNRSFFHAGTSNGNVVNGTTPDPLAWNVPTIFNVLEGMGVDWRIYTDTVITPSLTWLMSPQLWPYTLTRFGHFADFQSASASGLLLRYSFLEPSFVDKPNDEHPPHDVVAGEQFLWDIWQAVSLSPAWPETLLLITFDEHGGNYDHVMPPRGAADPDDKSNPGEQSFGFDRFGVRAPMIAVSPLIAPGTVFRSNTSVPYDHTSVLATLRDWLSIPPDKMLASRRIEAAPTLAQLLTLATPRTTLPDVSQSATEVTETSTFLPPNTLQKSMVSALAVQRNADPSAALASVQTRQDASTTCKRASRHPELPRRSCRSSSHIAIPGALLASAPNCSLGQTPQQIRSVGEFYAHADGFSGDAVVFRNGIIISNEGYGLANVELGVPITAKTRFAIRSVTKQFTAASILLLQEQGLLKTTDTLYRAPAVSQSKPAHLSFASRICH